MWIKYQLIITEIKKVNSIKKSNKILFIEIITNINEIGFPEKLSIRRIELKNKHIFFFFILDN